VREASAPAKINLALVVGELRSDGKHEVATVLQRIDLADRIALEAANRIEIEGFFEDTLVREALHAIGVTAKVRIEKRIPVAAGLGGGSSDAATTLRLANDTLERSLRPKEVHQLALGLGADVPFFLKEGPQLAHGSGAALSQLTLPQDYVIVLVLPTGAKKVSTKAVYDAFDRRSGQNRFSERRNSLHTALAEVETALDLAKLPPNDLASSPIADELRELGAFRADVTGAGPAVYGLFAEAAQAEAAREVLRGHGQTWLAKPAW
jgi:4-diphosphocytidyl-2-C-methyl-D-erythritol kinase